MGKQVTIKLLDPIDVPGKPPITEVVVRKPTFAEFCEHLDPFTTGFTKEGVPFISENPEAIRGYIRACVVKPEDPNLLRLGDFSVGSQIKQEILGFFLRAGGDTDSSAEVLKTSPENSSSPAGDRPLISIV